MLCSLLILLTCFLHRSSVKYAVAFLPALFLLSFMSSSSSSAPPATDLRVCASSGDLAEQLFQLLKRTSEEAVQARGAFHVALSGGSLPSTLAKALLDSEGKPRLETSQWHFWFADERCVKLNDTDSNFAEAQKNVFKHLPAIAPERMHAIDDSKADNPAEVRFHPFLFFFPFFC